MQTITIVQSLSARALAGFLSGKSSATVEAEYGDTCVEGSVLTLAHHGARSANPAPCLRGNDPVDVEVIGVSHVDLDALGGILSVLGRKPEVEGFWELAGFVDTHGPHHLRDSGATPENVRRLNAVWAWNANNRVDGERLGPEEVRDVTDRVLQRAEALTRILADDPELLAAGDAWAKDNSRKNRESFVEMEDGVAVRVAAWFVNADYESPLDGSMAVANVGYNPTFGSITIGFADPIPGVSARDIVQGLWGSEAGGHVGIAGSPRNRRMTLGDLVDAWHATRAAVLAARP